MKNYLFIMLLFFVFSESVNAATVFENGNMSNVSGGNNAFTYTPKTDGFTLSSAIQFDTFTYNAFTHSNVASPSSATFAIFNATDTSMLNALVSLNLQSVSRTTVGLLGGYNLDDFSWSLGSNYTLAAGNYFIRLAVNGTGYDHHWSIVGTTDTSPLTDNRWDHYFRLESNSQNSQSVPEPATVSLIGLGLAGLAARRRKSV